MEQHSMLGRVRVFPGQPTVTVSYHNKRRVAVYQSEDNKAIACTDFADTMSVNGKILCVQRYWNFGPHSRVVLFGKYETKAYEQLRKYIHQWYIVEGKTKLPNNHV